MKNNLNLSREKSLYGFILLCLIGLLVVLYKGFYTKEGFDNDSENTIV